MTPALLLAAAAGWGSAGEADAFRYLIDCAAAADGAVYVVDRRLPGVWRVGPDAAKPAVFKTGGRVFRTPLNAPRCVAVAPPSDVFPGGAVLVGDSATRAVYRLSVDGGDEPAATPLVPGDATAGVPSAVAAGADGAVFAADLESQRLLRLPPGGGGWEPVAAVAGVRGLCVAADGSLLAVTSEADAVRRFRPTGDGRWAASVAVAGRPFGNLQGAAVGPGGTLFVADNAAGCVWALSPQGEGFGDPVKLAAGAPLVGPTGVCVDRSADPPRLLVADPRARAVFAVRLRDGAVTVRAK